MMRNTYYVDGSFVDATEAVIPVNDLAVLRGFGVFDFLRTYGGKPFKLHEHIVRLRRSCQVIELAFPWNLADVQEIVEQTLARNANPESNIRLVVTGGPSSDSITPQGKSRLLVMVTPIMEMPPQWYVEGAKVITVNLARAFPEAKTINYIPAMVALNEARRADAIEALYRDCNDRVLEGTTTNLFMFQGDRLITPGQMILPGITRQCLLELAGDHFDVQIRDVFYDELRKADELFISASNKEVVPIVAVNDFIVGNGKPGARTQKIIDLFKDYTTRFAQMK